MSWDFKFDLDCFLILPLLAIEQVYCEDCEEPHGAALIVGWLFWQVAITFPDE